MIESPAARVPRVVLDVLRVFCGFDGRHGSELGVVRNGSALQGEAARQSAAARLGCHQTVFVDDPERGIVEVYDPARRLDFAAGALVAAAWLLDIDELAGPAGEVFARHDGECTWITAHAHWASPHTLRQYPSPAEVDALAAPPPGEGTLYAWAWQDELSSRVRARAFRRQGDATVEDEASPGAALLLTHELDRALNICQGRGSQILTAPGLYGEIELGGRVRLTRPTAPMPPP